LKRGRGRKRLEEGEGNVHGPLNGLRGAVCKGGNNQLAPRRSAEGGGDLVKKRRGSEGGALKGAALTKKGNTEEKIVDTCKGDTPYKPRAYARVGGHKLKLVKGAKTGSLNGTRPDSGEDPGSKQNPLGRV